MKRLLFLLLVIATPLSAGQHVENLHWMAGRWAATINEVQMEEHWSAPAGSMMVGMHRDVLNGSATFEFLRIVQTSAGITLHAQPAGGAATEFPLVDMMENYVVFANPKHDFPSRITYELRDGKLCAKVEGKGGEPEEWCWERK
jgi:hypothetical protein